MGFVTESSMRTDYTTLFYLPLKEYKMVGGVNMCDDKHIIGYLTPNGILIEIVGEEMDSQSVDEFVIFSHEIEIRDEGAIERIKKQYKIKEERSL